ncbi:MAG: chorismate-binding protein [Legionella sp.]
MKTLIIDNYDSFTYNLVHLVAVINGVLPDVYTNDVDNWAKINFSSYDNILLSPGPGHPNHAEDFGMCTRIIAEINKPILGICLGHQGIAAYFGADVVHALRPKHGCVETMQHQQDPLFAGIPTQFKAVRYHSLVVASPVPNDLNVICWSAQHEIMGIRHRTKKIWGVQFHPESICSEYGEQLLYNFMRLTNPHHDRAMGCISAVVPQSTTPPRHEYTLHFRKISSPVSLTTIYRFLEKQQEYLAWLDTSDPHHESSSCSLIAYPGGKLGEIMQYSLAHQTLDCLRAGSQLKVEGIFEYLKQWFAGAHIHKNDFPYPFQGGLVGYFGYELKAETLGVLNRYGSPYPDAYFLFCDRIIVHDVKTDEYYLVAIDKDGQSLIEINAWFDNLSQVIQTLTAQPFAAVANPTTYLNSEDYLQISKTDYLNKIRESMVYIRDGQSYELCLTNRLQDGQSIDSLAYYEILRSINPAPYAALLKLGSFSICSASIECFLQCNGRGKLITKPIKGTLPRLTHPKQDALQRKKLVSDLKFRSENLMIVDLLRNDLAKVCQPGSVHVARLMAVESYSTVHQLVSTIEGMMQPESTFIDAIFACFPPGSMTGAPKKRTVELIDNMESSARAMYAGALGYLSLNGAANLSVVMRTAIIDKDQFQIGVGGAIIDLSDCEEEYQEMVLKAKALLTALAIYQVTNR